MKRLAVDDFANYYRELHGPKQPPFPWQNRLMREVAADGCWPCLLNLPTGTGKTSVLDIAIFALALDADRSPEQRKAARRIILVVDRRTVVDQAYLRAQKIAQRLETAASSMDEELPVLRIVAERLRTLSAEGVRTPAASPPLGVHLLRGGMPRDNDWAKSPTQPLVAVSPVDQVGSRLLFRGYGISPRMQPVHAGLLGNDVLFLLDEVHLAQPFRDLLLDLGKRYRSFASAGLPDRWQVVQMSATPEQQPANCFELSGEDHDHPVLRQRLEARKPARLVAVPVAGTEDRRKRALAKIIAESAAEWFDAPRAVGIVVNRVQTARLIWAELQAPVASAGGEIHLVTGRMRPFDGEEVEQVLRREVGSDRDRSRRRLVVVVATQCIEAGADLDFDCLLTECASLDALRQRFGRLDRLGISGEGTGNGTEQKAKGLVFAREDHVGAKATEDPVYGAAVRTTWEYLSSLPELDFGLHRLPLPEPSRLAALLTRPGKGPVLLPAHLDAWVQTSPPPHADPEPGLWLHGIEQRQAEISLVWRADLTEGDLWDALRSPIARGVEATGAPRAMRAQVGNADARHGRADAPAPAWLEARLDACPPRTMEALEVPLTACRFWLRGEAPTDISDAGTMPEWDDDRSKRSEGRPVVVWRRDQRLVVLPSRLAPGDVVLVPSTYGGLSASNWDPHSAGPWAACAVSDLGDRAQLWQRARAQVRLDPRVIAGMRVDVLDLVPNLDRPDDPDFEPVREAQEYLRTTPEEQWVPWARPLFAALAGADCRPEDLRLVRIPRARAGAEQDDEEAGATFALMRREPLSRRELARLRTLHASGPARDAAGMVETTTDAEQASLTGVPVTLREHHQGVGDWAGRFARACGLSSDLASAFELAGQWHDLGKADPRFQRWLHQGSSYRASVAEEPLAKSSLPSHDRRARERARERAGYPRGTRHELMSLALMSSLPEFAERAGEHWELVQYLVATHHGWCRPFAPFVPDPDPVGVEVVWGAATLRAMSGHELARIDSGIAERFWMLVRRYGWHGLAWLEAVFQLADHRRSELEVSLALAAKEEQSHAA